jgi:hypothetical protein
LLIDNDHSNAIDVSDKGYIKWAFLTAFLYGNSNFISGELSSRLGPAGGYPFFIGNLLSWTIFHVIIGCKLKKRKGVFWSKSESMYYDENSKKIKWLSVMGPLCRGCL